MSPEVNGGQPETALAGEAVQTLVAEIKPLKGKGGRKRGKLPATPAPTETPVVSIDPELAAVLASFEETPAPVTAPEETAVQTALEETPAAGAGTQPLEPSVTIDPDLQAALDSLGGDVPASTLTTTPEQLTAQTAEEAAPAGPPPARRSGLLDFARGLGNRFRRSTPPVQPPAAAPAVPVTTEEIAVPAGQQPTEGETPVVTTAGGLLDFARGLGNRRQPTPPTPTVTAEDQQQTTEEDQAAVDTNVQPRVQAPAAETLEPQAAREPATPAERVRQKRLIDRIATQLEKTRVFGKPLPELAFNKIGFGGVRWGAKELAKGIVSWSGVAGAVGGGIAGTAVTGAFVGAVAGAAVEYVRQVDANLSTRVTEENPNLTSRKAIFLAKLKETRQHKEVFTQVNKGKLARAALFGAITGAGAGAIAEIPGVREFLHHAVGEVAKTVGTAGGEIWKGAGDIAGNVGKEIGQAPGMEGLGIAAGIRGETYGALAGDAGGAIGEAGGTIGRIVGDTGGNIGHTAGEKMGEAGRWANIGGAGDAVKEAARQADLDELKAQLNDQRAVIDNLKNQVAEAQKIASEAQSALKAPETTAGFVPKADLDAANARIDDLQKQFAAIKQAGTEIIPPADQAVAAAKTAAEQATARATEAAQTQIQEAFASFGDSYALHPGDSVAGITEKLGKSLGLSNTQIWELGQKMAQENGVTSQYYGTIGNVLDRNLPIGKVMNMQGVKALTTEMLKNKVQ